MRHVGELAALLEYEVDLLDSGVVPVVLEAVLAGLCLCTEQIVFVGGLEFRLVLGTLVGVCLAVTGIEGVVALGVEGHHVVVQETRFAASLAGPPAQGVTHGAASEVTVLGGVPHPCLGGAAGDGTHVRSGVEGVAVGFVHGEGLEHGAGGHAVGIVSLDFHLMLTGLAETQGNAVPGVGIDLGGLAVDKFGTEIPHRHHPLVFEGEGSHVGRLVNLYDHIEVGSAGQRRLYKLGILRLAGDKGETCQCDCADIFPNVFHCLED